MSEATVNSPSGGPASREVAPGLDPAVEPSVSYVLDGRPATARPGEMLISAAERSGTFIPRFCYHPRMKSVGVCRMCLVEVSGPRGATLQPSCFIPVSEGMEVDTTSDKVKKAQEGVLEFLLVNHPLDCPVCDKGGECPLQDQTLAYGPGESRFVEEKRHFEKPIAISELVLLDRERCIQCARCTRFADEVAGEALIDFAGRGENLEVATFPTEPFSSYFSGNTVQICPVGALTATPYRFTARPWDLDQVESTCTTCALGCRVAVQSSGNRLTRLLGIDSEPVNHGWLCDKGRFVFEAVNGDEASAGSGAGAEAAVGTEVDIAPATAAQVVPLAATPGQFSGEAHQTGLTESGLYGGLASSRVTQPLVRKAGELVPASWGEALAAAAAGLSAAVADGGAAGVAVLGGARLTNEDAYAWTKLAKAVIGTDSVDAQLGDGLPAELVLGLPRATIDQACSAKVVLLLGGDVREELPVLFLRLREAVLEGDTKVIEIAQRPTATAGLASVTLPARPGDAPALARALAGDDSGMPALRSHPEGAACSPELLEKARALLSGAAAGTDSGQPPGTGVVVVLGRPSLAEAAGITAEAAQVLAAALPGASFLPALRRGNIHGALDMGLAPGLLPGRVSLERGTATFTAAWGTVPARTGLDATAVLSALAGSSTGGGGDRPAIKALILLGADPLTDFPDRTLAEEALAAAGHVVAICGHRSASLDHADVVLPAAVAHERAGTTTNIEGRVTRLAQKLVPPGQAWPDWMIASELASELGGDLGIASMGNLEDEIDGLAPAYAGIRDAMLATNGGIDGVVAPLPAGTGGPQGSAGHAIRPTPRRIDPIALPGVESAELQGAPARVGLAEPPPTEDGTAGGDTAGAEAASGHSTIVVARSVQQLADGPLTNTPGPHVAPPDSYSLRLVAARRLYDAGSAVSASPSLSALVPALQAMANPYDLDRLGLGSGDQVRVRSARGSLELEARADVRIPRGVVAIDFNVPLHGSLVPIADGERGTDVITAATAAAGPDNAVATLIDATDPVTEVRLETV